MDQLETIEESTAPAPQPDPLSPVRNMVQSCIQCGTCTGSCPNAFAMDYTPRRLWRMVLMGKEEEIFESKTFALCSVCYYCTLRCPRGLKLTEAMSALKQYAAREKLAPYRQSSRFYQSFIDSVRRHGRVREMEFMTFYFLSMSLVNPFLPLKFTPLGMKLMAKRKISIEMPSRGKRPLEAIFRKVEELEGKP
jgi:heterodisulfide reductase subunit C